MRLPILLATAAFSAAPLHAETREDEGLWINTTVQGAVTGDRLVYFAELQPRFADGLGRLDQLLLRPAIGWKASERLTLYQGFAYVLNRPEGAAERREHRSFQQASWNVGRVGPGDLSLRTRLEQRWLSDGDDTGWRLRQMVRYRLPLRREARGPGLLLSAEPFIALNDTDWGARGGFDQVRGFAGVELPVGGASTVEAGYLNQLIDRGGGVRQMNHVASLSIFLRH